MPTEGGGAGVAFKARREGVVMSKLEGNAPNGSRATAVVVGSPHLGGGRAGV
jgi:hypothetical protein